MVVAAEAANAKLKIKNAKTAAGGSLVFIV
jgi:hypothetical protein